jgi:hypothetical protein
MRTQPTVITATNRPGHTEACADLANLPDIADLAAVLVVLEGFLLHAQAHIAGELAAYPLVRPDDPRAWVSWVADLLGGHVITLRALIPTTGAPPAHPPIGEPR